MMMQNHISRRLITVSDGAFNKFLVAAGVMYALVTITMFHIISQQDADTSGMFSGDSLISNLSAHLQNNHFSNFHSKIDTAEADMRPVNVQEVEKSDNSTKTHWTTTKSKQEFMEKGREKQKQKNINLDEVGDKSKRYHDIRETYDARFPPDDIERLRATAKSVRKRDYVPMHGEIDCPEHPPEGYPQHYNVMDVIENWPPDDTEPRDNIYQGLCVFDYSKEGDYEKAMNYRNAEVPFVMRDDPELLRAVERWADPEYLLKLLPAKSAQRAEYSHDNHFMYWNANKGKRRNYPNWENPTEMIRMSYPEWLEKARQPDDMTTVEKDHWYFRLISCGAWDHCRASGSEFIFDELTFFRPKPSLYIVDPEAQRGVHCRFGMRGVIAENHFDGSRNSIALMGGERRYMLSHPSNCGEMGLYPKGHPSARHSAVDWSNPDLEKYLKFKDLMVHEIVLQAGDVLYLPTNYFHYIISLDLNYQCNTRSGSTDETKEYIQNCGF